MDDGNQSSDIEEYDYTAQNLLQAPFEKSGLKNLLQNALSTRKMAKAPVQKNSSVFCSWA